MSDVSEAKALSTADLVAATKAPSTPTAQRAPDAAQGADREPLAALFAPEAAVQFRSQWDRVQIGFVDDPRQAVRQADELVAQVMANLAETFARERSQLEGYVSGNEAAASTENLRVALRRYRSFFQRLLAL
jgi:hypothetical protein